MLLLGKQPDGAHRERFEEILQARAAWDAAFREHATCAGELSGFRERLGEEFLVAPRAFQALVAAGDRYRAERHAEAANQVVGAQAPAAQHDEAGRTLSPPGKKPPLLWPSAGPSTGRSTNWTPGAH